MDKSIHKCELFIVTRLDISVLQSLSVYFAFNSGLYKMNMIFWTYSMFMIHWHPSIFNNTSLDFLQQPVHLIHILQRLLPNPKSSEFNPYIVEEPIPFWRPLAPDQNLAKQFLLRKKKVSRKISHYYSWQCQEEEEQVLYVLWRPLRSRLKKKRNKICWKKNNNNLVEPPADSFFVGAASETIWIVTAPRHKI